MTEEKLKRANDLAKWINRYKTILSNGVIGITHKFEGRISYTELDEITEKKVEEIIKERREELKKEFEKL